MADQKRWFKVWGSIVGDPHFGELALEDVARWTLLGAYVAIHGTRGVLHVPGEARTLCQVLRVADREGAVEVLRRLPNVHVSEAMTPRANRYGTSYPQGANEEGKRVDGDFTVTLSNWRLYQEDSTARERMKTLRAKRRGEVTATPTATALPPNPPQAGGSSAPRNGSHPEPDEARAILDFLNRKTGHHYRPAAATLALIRARLNSGATPAQIRAVIAVKRREWANDPERARFLRPETLFRASKFESYLGQLPAGAFEKEEITDA